MPTDPRDESDPTGEIPLVVPVSDSIGAVDLDPVIDDSEQDATHDPSSAADAATHVAAAADAPNDVTVSDAPTDVTASDAPTEVAAAAGHSTGVSDDVATSAAPTVRSRVAEPTGIGTSEAPVTQAGPASTPVRGVPVYEVPAAVTYERSRRRWPRRLLIGLAVVAVLALAYYGFNLWQVWSTGRSDQARPVDALVVMGAAQYDGRPSPQLEERLDHVVTLWEQGLAPSVIVTGGNLPGDRFTEAEASGTYLIERGVPPTAILYENAGSNSYDSLVGVAAIMSERGLEEALIVTDPYHALRSKMIAEELGITAYVSPTPTSVVTGASELRRELGEAAGVALGRIIGFDRLASLTG